MRGETATVTWSFLRRIITRPMRRAGASVAYRAEVVIRKASTTSEHTMSGNCAAVRSQSARMWRTRASYTLLVKQRLSDLAYAGEGDSCALLHCQRMIGWLKLDGGPLAEWARVHVCLEINR